MIPAALVVFLICKGLTCQVAVLPTMSVAQCEAKPIETVAAALKVSGRYSGTPRFPVFCFANL